MQSFDACVGHNIKHAAPGKYYKKGESEPQLTVFSDGSGEGKYNAKGVNELIAEFDLVRK